MKTPTKGTLIFFCGKMGAGKSTQARDFAISENGILISEDDWLSALYPDEILDFSDYLKYAARLKQRMKPHVQQLLKKGVTVVMDYPANTQKQRQWFKCIYTEVEALHQLYYLKASDETCLLNIAKRRSEHPERAAFDTKAVFHEVTAYFQAPTDTEAFNLSLIER